MPRFLQGAAFRLPDLLTIIVEGDRGSLNATYIAEGSVPPESGGYADMDELVAAVNQAVLDLYSEHLGDRMMGVQYAWYPWGEHKPPKNAGLPKDFYLLFEIQASGDGYTASVPSEPSTRVEAATLQELCQAAEATAVRHWPALESNGIPGMMHWNRDLVSGQFRDDAD